MNNNSYFLLIFIILILFGIPVSSQISGSLESATPEKEGISSETILKFLHSIDSSNIEMHSFMLIKNGKKIIDASWFPYSGKNKHMLYSITKTFASTAIGFCIDDKLLSIDDKVISFFPQYQNNDQNPYLDELCVKHLLSMTVGQHAEGPYSDPIALAVEKNDDWVKIFFSVPILHKPGTVFLYNTLASHVLSAIVERVTQKSTSAYLNQKLFNPLGIKDFDWEVSPTGVNTGGWGLRLNTEDMIKVGLLFLQRGKWKNKKLLSEKWINDAITFKVDLKNLSEKDTSRRNNWNQGYGYQWWLYQQGIFAAQGSEGQSIIVIPENNVVIAITANVNQKQLVTNLIKTILLPGFGKEKLMPDKKGFALLQQKISALRLLPTKGIKYEGESCHFDFQSNNKGIKSVAFDYSDQICLLQINLENDTFNLNFGKEKWYLGETTKKGPYRMHSPTSFQGLPPFKIAGSYHWQNENSLILTLRYLESAHFETYTCSFVGNKLKMEVKSSMNVVHNYSSVD